MQMLCFRSPWGIEHKAIFRIDNKQVTLALLEW